MKHTHSSHRTFGPQKQTYIWPINYLTESIYFHWFIGGGAAKPSWCFITRWIGTLLFVPSGCTRTSYFRRMVHTKLKLRKPAFPWFKVEGLRKPNQWIRLSLNCFISREKLVILSITLTLLSYSLAWSSGAPFSGVHSAENTIAVSYGVAIDSVRLGIW